MCFQKLIVTSWKCISLQWVKIFIGLAFVFIVFGFSGEPNNSMGNENCLAMFGDDPDQEYYEAGTWNDENCDKELPFICQCPSAEGIFTRQ